MANARPLWKSVKDGMPEMKKGRVIVVSSRFTHFPEHFYTELLFAHPDGKEIHRDTGRYSGEDVNNLITYHGDPGWYTKTGRLPFTPSNNSFWTDVPLPLLPTTRTDEQ